MRFERRSRRVRADINEKNGPQGAMPAAMIIAVPARRYVPAGRLIVIKEIDMNTYKTLEFDIIRSVLAENALSENAKDR